MKKFEKKHLQNSDTRFYKDFEGEKCSMELFRQRRYRGVPVDEAILPVNENTKVVIEKSPEDLQKLEALDKIYYSDPVIINNRRILWENYKQKESEVIKDKFMFFLSRWFKSIELKNLYWVEFY